MLTIDIDMDEVRAETMTAYYDIAEAIGDFLEGLFDNVEEALQSLGE